MNSALLKLPAHQGRLVSLPGRLWCDFFFVHKDTLAPLTRVHGQWFYSYFKTHCTVSHRAYSRECNRVGASITGRDTWLEAHIFSDTMQLEWLRIRIRRLMVWVRHAHRTARRRAGSSCHLQVRDTHVQQGDNHLQWAARFSSPPVSPVTSVHTVR